jgi:hypothetical protein
MGAALPMALSLRSQASMSSRSLIEEPDDEEELDDPMEDIEPDDEISQQIVTKSKKTMKKTTRKRKMKSKRKIIRKSQQINDIDDEDPSKSLIQHFGISESQLKDGYLMDGPIMYAAEILKYRQDLIPRLQRWRERWLCRSIGCRSIQVWGGRDHAIYPHPPRCHLQGDAGPSPNCRRIPSAWLSECVTFKSCWLSQGSILFSHLLSHIVFVH